LIIKINDTGEELDKDLEETKKTSNEIKKTVRRPTRRFKKSLASDLVVSKEPIVNFEVIPIEIPQIETLTQKNTNLIGNFGKEEQQLYNENSTKINPTGLNRRRSVKK
jgi:hypothetical protein